MTLSLRALTPPDLAQLGELTARRLGEPGVVVLGAQEGERWVGTCTIEDRGVVSLVTPPLCLTRYWAKAHPALLGAALEQSLAWGARGQLGFLDARDTLNLAALQELGFWPRHFMTGMSVTSREDRAWPAGWLHAHAGWPEGLLAAAENLFDELSPGLRLPNLLAAEHPHELVFRWEGARLSALAIARASEGERALRIRVAAVRPGPEAHAHFEQLLDACELTGRRLAKPELHLCLNAAHSEAHTTLLGRGFQNTGQGFALHHPNEPFFCRPGLYWLDDWR